ncbi:ABC transporter ATP-binding protein [Methyloferula stellata]|uniref:ABC transporter ATP-binding protein n=1 Tax=Methyloferula stellata TaxID=876270 RepID=UPI00037E8670|nr:ABC transporter ATP-binding protein [Methyloferula stellata]
MAEPLLQVRDLNAWYGAAHVLQGVSLDVGRGEIVALVGRNGAGKTTTVRTIMGLIAKRSGTILFDGIDLMARQTYERFGLGLGYVPEERRIVPGLTVRENLMLGLLAARRGMAGEAEAINAVAMRFPRLGERLNQEAVTMSGGEQQMLAIARAMLSQPTMILLDEPSEGIMPALVDEMAELFLELKRSGTSLLLIEQNVELALEISDRAYILDQGRLVHEGASAELLADADIRERYCGLITESHDGA